ncbi:hypothetical protein FIU40_05955 [Enterococcus faecium]|nr:hypothetical protein FIU40_05955 [Enterococcus faecium]
MFDIRMPSFFFLVLSSNDVSFTTIFHFMVRNQKNIFHFLIFYWGFFDSISYLVRSFIRDNIFLFYTYKWHFSTISSCYYFINI